MDHEELERSVILASAVENTNEAFVTIDEDHRVMFFNRAAEELFGYGREEVLGRDLNEIMSPACSRDHRQAVTEYVRRGIPKRIGHDTEITVTRKTGETIPASISFSVSRVGGRLFFTGILTDLTKTKALQARIARSERLAALGQLVAEITHEIKNPLMMIGGFARQLLRHIGDERDARKLSIIMDEIQRLEYLLSELRDLYIPRNIKAQKVDVHELVGEVSTLIEENCRSRGIHVRTLAGKEPIYVMGDREKLKQVFLNLTKNAMEAMDKNGNLEIRCTRSGDKIEVSVSDDGRGIPESEQKKVFLPFFSTKGHGTGLGLSVSKRIVEEHQGGCISFQSTQGRGTIFRVSLPVYEQSAPGMGPVGQL